MEDIKSKLLQTNPVVKDREVILSTYTTSKKVLFVSTGYYDLQGERLSLYPEGEWLMTSIVDKVMGSDEWQVIPAIKTYNVLEEDMTTEDYNFYREILMKELEDIQPDLIIPLGNVALRSVTKQSGITNKRGCELFIKSETTGKVITVIPTFSEEVIYNEPMYRSLFKDDIKNSYGKVIKSLNKLHEKGYEVCMDMDSVRKNIAKCMSSSYIGCDTETTGLDFKQDTMTCFGASFEDGTAFIVPLHHFESPFTDSEIEEIVSLLSDLHANENVLKFYANVKFDVKFLIELGVKEFKSCQDIQFMHSLVDENRSHKLVELIKKYYPTEIENY